MIEGVSKLIYFRYIVLHAGNKNGFIGGTEFVFLSNTKNPDYHEEMNEANFLHWFDHQLLMNLSEPLMIVMNNAFYLSTLVSKSPSNALRKMEIQELLTTRAIQFNENMLKTEFLLLVSR